MNGSTIARLRMILAVSLAALLTAGCTALPKIDESLLEAAHAGDVNAEYRVGEIYRRAYYASLFGSFALWEEAAKYYEQAAEQGHPGAQYWLSGYYFTFGDHYPESFYWVRKAAMGGIAEAQVNLGAHFAQGWGTAPDVIQAYKWLTLGHEGGCADPIGKVVDTEWLVARTKMNAEQIAQGKRLAEEHTRIYGRSRSVLLDD